MAPTGSSTVPTALSLRTKDMRTDDRNWHIYNSNITLLDCIILVISTRVPVRMKPVIMNNSSFSFVNCPSCGVHVSVIVSSSQTTAGHAHHMQGFSHAYFFFKTDGYSTGIAICECRRVESSQYVKDCIKLFYLVHEQ